MLANVMVKINKNQKTEFTLKDILFIPYRDFYFVVNLSDILYIKAERAYCKVVITSGKTYLMSTYIKTLQNKLPENFIRTHNSYLVNILYANSIHNGSIIKLNNNYEIPISRRKKKEIFASVVTV